MSPERDEDRRGVAGGADPGAVPGAPPGRHRARRSQASTGTATTTACTAARRAAPSCSTPTPSSSRARAGRASRSPRSPTPSSCVATCSARHGPHRGRVPPLRRPPRSRLRRRPRPDRPALLHQLAVARPRSRRRFVTQAAGSPAAPQLVEFGTARRAVGDPRRHPRLWRRVPRLDGRQRGAARHRRRPGRRSLGPAVDARRATS